MTSVVLSSANFTRAMCFSFPTKFGHTPSDVRFLVVSCYRKSNMKNLTSQASLALLLLHSVGAFAPQSHTSVSAGTSIRPASLVPSRRWVVTRPSLDRVSTSPVETPIVREETLGASDTSSDEYQQGFTIISFITLLNASLAPVWHTVFAEGGPPPLFLNAVVSVVALIGLLTLGPLLDRNVDSMAALAENNEEKWSLKSFRGGMELGVWKGLGTLQWLVSSF